MIKESKESLTIAISGPPGAGSTTVAKKLAKKLKLDYFSPGEFFKRHSKEKKMRALKFWKTEQGKSDELHHKIDEKQKEKARQGNIVVCGKLSIHVLKDLADLKIWIDCPLKVRAKRVAKREGLSVYEALRKIKEREEIEKKEWMRIYGFDYFDSRDIADLDIISSDKTPEEIVQIIFNYIRDKS